MSVADGIRGLFSQLHSRILLYVKYTFIGLEVRSIFDDCVTLKWISDFDVVLDFRGAYCFPSH